MLAGGAGSCPAADGLSGSIGATTDYIHRGVSQSDGHAALQASLVYWHPAGLYGGVWGSTLHERRPFSYSSYGSIKSEFELDLFAGFSKPVGSDWTLDFKAVAYLYPDDASLVDYDYVELTFGGAWRQRLVTTVSVAPRTTWIARAGGGQDRTAVGGEVAWQQPVTGWLTLTAGAGYRELLAEGRSGYLYGSTSLALQLRHGSVELGWFTTDSAARWLFGSRLTGSRAALSARVSF
jgi:uncharacterized protein (TIGR02001 family)